MMPKLWNMSGTELAEYFGIPYLMGQELAEAFTEARAAARYGAALEAVEVAGFAKTATEARNKLRNLARAAEGKL
jgi:hypothetical protein